MWKPVAILATVLVGTSGQIAALAGAISTAWSAIQGVLSAFKTTSKDTLLETLTDQGYKTFMDKTDVDISQSIPDQYWPVFVQHMSTNLYIPREKIQDFTDYLMDIQYIGSDDWSAIQTSFSTSTGGACTYIMICTNHNIGNKTYNWIHANVDAAFTLMPNVFVIAHEQSSFFSDRVSIKFINKPAGVTEKDFEPIFAFLKVIAFKQIGAMIGLDLPL
jgi:hypothetical protein